MDLLGIGPLELIFVLLIVLLILGPDDLVKTGRNLGRFLSRVVKSEGWKAVRETMRELRQLPNRLAREAELESFQQSSQQKNTPTSANPSTPNATEQDRARIENGIKAWTSPPAPGSNAGSNQPDREEKDEETAHHHQPQQK